MAVIDAIQKFSMDEFSLRPFYQLMTNRIINDREGDVDRGPGPGGDNYVIRNSNDDAVEYFGSGFAYDGEGHMTQGTVNGLFEWHWNQGELTWDKEFSISNAVSVSTQAVFDAGQTTTRSDDLAVLKVMFRGNDRFDLSWDDDMARGYYGNDLLVGHGGNDKLIGDAGRDTVYGGEGNDTVTGGYGNDIVHGDDGKDLVKGGHGTDKLYGGRSSDVIIGGSGNDVLRGGSGWDRLAGGYGRDTFVFADGDDKDVIRDFDTVGSVQDRIDLRGLSSITSWQDMQANHLREEGTSTIIDGGDGDYIVLQNTSISDLNESNFIF